MIELCCEYLSTVHLTVCHYHVMHSFQSESTLYSCLNVKEFLARNRPNIWSLTDSNRIRTNNHLVRKRTLNHLAKLSKWLSCVVSTYLYHAFYYHVKCAIQSESIFYICLNDKELLSQNRHNIYSLSDSNGIRNHNHSVCKRTLKHLAKLRKWLSCVVSTYLYDASKLKFKQ